MKYRIYKVLLKTDLFATYSLNTIDLRSINMHFNFIVGYSNINEGEVVLNERNQLNAHVL